MSHYREKGLFCMGKKTLIATTSKYDGVKNFDSNTNQSLFIATINLSDTLNDSTNYFFEQFY